MKKKEMFYFYFDRKWEEKIKINTSWDDEDSFFNVKNSKIVFFCLDIPQKNLLNLKNLMWRHQELIKEILIVELSSWKKERRKNKTLFQIEKQGFCLCVFFMFLSLKKSRMFSKFLLKKKGMFVNSNKCRCKCNVSSQGKA